VARLEKMREQFAGTAEFVFVYIKEAHPEDEWDAPVNKEKGIVFNQPKTFDERMKLAKTFVTKMDIETPTLVDDITNIGNACYAAWPERIYVIGTDGRIAYKGGMGPFKFDPDELEEFLNANYGA
jgi:hypothetical protein